MSDSPSTPASQSSVRPARKLFEREWLEIVSLAKNGTSIPKIAEIYDVHHTVIYRGLRKKGVKIGSLIADASAEELEKSRDLMVQRIKETKEKDYKFTEFLQQQIVKTISDTIKNGRAIGTALDDVKALKIAIDGVRNATDNKWRILGLDKENQDADAALPELPIREMTSHEVDSIRNRQDLEDGNLSAEDMEAAMDIARDMTGNPDDDDIADEDEPVAF